MAINLKILPGRIVTRDDFISSHPAYSIALDGYVSGEPFLEIRPHGPYRNFNHHEAVDRSCTSATCEQVRRAIILGLFDLFRKDGAPYADVWVNDCDQDVCLATWILLNPDRADEPWVRTLVYIEDLLDMSAGGFPMPGERDLLGEVRWVFEPYTSRRPIIGSLNETDMLAIIEDVHGRIEAFLDGTGETLPLLGDYVELGGGAGWTLAEVNHQHARQKMVEAGIKAAVELFGRKGDHYLYSVWRRSEYIVNFPVLDILSALNRAEGFVEGDTSGWGGSENVGGSPRAGGSKLSPAEVEVVVNEVVDRLAARAP
jgi:hypothetical protein